MLMSAPLVVRFFLKGTATTEIYPLSLHDALPICNGCSNCCCGLKLATYRHQCLSRGHGFSTGRLDRKSTRLNSSHVAISYAVFCLKKKSTEWHSRLQDAKTSTDTAKCATHSQCCG